MHPKITVPLRKSLLPSADEILPYLVRIDQARWYSNFGLLSQEFQTRLAIHFGVDNDEILAVANGTLGLELALRAACPGNGGWCALPSLTFPATVSAVVSAGFKPYFLDVDRDTLTLDLEAVRRLRTDLGPELQAVVPVSPYGRPVPTDDWQQLGRDTGITVVVDAAWCFDSLQACAMPQVVSLHATKVLGIGEGGVVVARDKDLIENMRRRSNFGFSPEKEVVAIGTNGKISEFTAAVGLAALDRWPATRTGLISLRDRYLARLATIPGLHTLPDATDDWASATVAVLLENGDAARISEEMAARGVESRHWWGRPCHHHTALRHIPHGGLENTEHLYACLLNLPFYEDMDDAEIEQVVSALEAAL